MNFFFLIIALILNATANILLKVGASNGIKLGGGVVDSFRANMVPVIGLGLFALNVVFYFLALRGIPLSTAYPIMTIMSFVIINTAAYFYLNEHINGWQLVGYGFLIVGLIFVFYFSEKYPT